MINAYVRQRLAPETSQVRVVVSLSLTAIAMTTRGGAIEQESLLEPPEVGGESIPAQAQDVTFSAEFYIPWVILKVHLANYPSVHSC